MLLRVCEWLASTSGSIALHESHYLFLAVLSVHVLTLTVFLGTSILIDLRFLGLAMIRVPVSEVVSRLLPWTLAGFVVMVASGALLFYAAPVLRYENVFFRLKMGALVLALVNAWAFHATASARIAECDLDPVPPVRVRLAGGVSLLLWAIVLTAGRMMAYQDYWFD